MNGPPTSQAQPDTEVKSSGVQLELDANVYQKSVMYVPEYGIPLVTDLLKPQQGQKILDVGCGEGYLTQKIKDVTQYVVGVDYSQSMVDKCIQRGIEAYKLDAHDIGNRFPQNSFDSVFSNATLHWLKRNPQQVVDGIHKVLKPGGKFVAEMGGWGNVMSIQVAIEAAFQNIGKSSVDINPWYFPSKVEYQAILENSGFEVVDIKSFQRPTLLKGGTMDFIENFCGTFWEQVTKEQAKQMTDYIMRLTEPYLRASDGNIYLDYVRLQFVAKKK